MAEVGSIDPEHMGIIEDIQNGVKIEELPNEHILKQFMSKKRKTGELKITYDDMYTVETGRGELIYMDTKLVPPRATRPDIVEAAYQGPFSQDSIYNNLCKYYYWPHMREFVEAKASKCYKCRFHKSQTQDSNHLCQLNCKHSSQVSVGVWIS